MTTLARPKELSNRTRRGRAINSIAEFLRSSLTVPNIYLEPRIQGRLDVLAVDRGGGGDLHGVKIEVPAASDSYVSVREYVQKYNAQLRARPVHYKYLALPKTDNIALWFAQKLQLFSPDGIGRTGILLLTEHENSLPSVELAVKPERYRVSATDMAKVDKFLSKNRPDIEVRI